MIIRSVVRSTIVCTGLALACLTVNTACAAPITITASGTVDFVDDALSPPFALGQTFTMSYTFESTTPARIGSNSNFAAFDALTAISFTLDSYSASATGAEEIQVDNDPPGLADRYSAGPGAGSTITAASVNGLSLSGFFIRLDDTTNTAFSDATILPTSLSLSSFTSAGFALFFVDGQQNVFSVSGPLTSIVPEPASLALAACGMGVLVLAYRRKRR